MLQVSKKGFRRGSLSVKVPKKADDRPMGVVWPPEEPEDEEFDPERVAKLRKTQLIAAKRVEGQKERPKPPLLSVYLLTIFRENDGTNRGAFSANEFTECMMGLGLGVSKQDVNALFKKAEKNYDGEILWTGFAENADTILK